MMSSDGDLNVEIIAVDNDDGTFLVLGNLPLDNTLSIRTAMQIIAEAQALINHITQQILKVTSNSFEELEANIIANRRDEDMAPDFGGDTHS